MTKSRFMRATAAAVTSIGLITGLTGIAGAATSVGTIDTTGPHSSNTVRNDTSTQIRTSNTNRITATVRNDQHSSSGDATVRDNTRGGTALTGDASNDNTTRGTINVTNTSPDTSLLSDPSFDGLITDTGPYSTNRLTNTVRNTLNVTNQNTITLNTSSTQRAYSGDATVRDNTRGGDATTGNATNTNSSTFTVTVTNQ
jgi:hypothetical protein